MMRKIDALNYPLLLSIVVYVVCGLRYEHNSAATNAVVVPVVTSFFLLMTLGNLFVFNLPRELTYKKLLGKTIVITNIKLVNLILTSFVITSLCALTSSGLLFVSLAATICLMSLVRINLLSSNSIIPGSESAS
jgi:hypothetical protein